MKALERAQLTAFLFLVSLNSQCLENHASTKERNVPQINEYQAGDMVKCLNTNINDFKHDFQVQKRVFNLSHYFKTAALPLVDWVLAGDDFGYQCCDNGNIYSIYRFGLYKKGSIDPQKLICRVEVNKIRTVQCTVLWSSTFNVSKYNGRIFIGYNKTASCMVLTIRNVSVGDGNVFISIYRDDSIKKFESCIPMTLNVTKGSAPSTPIPTKETHSVPSSAKKESSRIEIKTVLPVAPSTSYKTIIAVILTVVALFALVIVFAFMFLRSKKRIMRRNVMSGGLQADQDSPAHSRYASISLLTATGETEEKRDDYGSMSTINDSYENE